MSKNDTKNNTAWEELFETHQILDKIHRNGFYNISSSTINKVREARLMAKFDQTENLPMLFKKNNLSILPVSRGEYIIGSFETYKTIEESNKYDEAIEHLTFPDHIESIDFENITSEATAINCAYISNILAHFCEENLLPTVSGRMSSNSFNFKINSIKTKEKLKINVKNAQVEIDGGYEGTESLSIIEAKMSLAQDFMIRQLYYPFRLWSAKISKKVRPIFLSYSNNIFYLSEYEFIDIYDYNSLVLKKHKRYSLEDMDITLDELRTIKDSTLIKPEQKVPFPQADSFERIINLCERLKLEELDKEQITNIYRFTSRQTDYYTNALLYLELAVKKKTAEGSTFYLSDKGKSILKSNYKRRQLSFVKQIFKHSVFQKVFALYINKAELPTKKSIVPIMKKEKLYNIDSEDTYKRRASTIIGWINWILDLRN